MNRPRRARSWWKTDFIASPRGASLIEIMVALFVVLLTALASGSFYASQTNTIRTLTRASSCKTTLEAQLSEIERAGGPSISMPWDASTTSLKVLTTDYPDPWMADTFRLKPISSASILYSGTKPATPALGNVLVLNSIMLQRSSMGLITSLYNNVPGICDGPIPFDKAWEKVAAVTADPLLLKNFASTIQIEPYNIQDGKLLGSCPLPLRPRPRGKMNPGASFPHPEGGGRADIPPIVDFLPETNPDIGFRITLRGQFDDFTGSQKNCSASQDFRYPADMTPPARPSIIINALPISAADVQPADAMLGKRSCTHNASTIPTAKLKLDIGFKFSGPIEPGTVFLCRDASEQIQPTAKKYCEGAVNAEMQGTPGWQGKAPWVPCDQVTACRVRPDPSQSAFSITPFSGKSQGGLGGSSGKNASPFSSEVKYSNTYINDPAFRPDDVGNDGIWGCDIRIDVATLDLAGNFTVLSQQSHPIAGLPPGVTITADHALKYFQPAECWACYKKKSSFLGGFIALALAVAFPIAAAGFLLAGGAIGLAASCAAGGGGVCTPKGMKFIGNKCKDESGGKVKCKKVEPAKPLWLGGVTPFCSAASFAYSSAFPGQTFNVPTSNSGEYYEGYTVDFAKAAWCSADAICNAPKWEGLDDDMNNPTPVVTCGNIYTEFEMATPGGAPKANCIAALDPNKGTTIMDDSQYGGFKVCDSSTFPFLTQAIYCNYSMMPVDPADPAAGMMPDPSSITYPVDPRTGGSATAPPYKYYKIVTPTDKNLPQCS